MRVEYHSDFIDFELKDGTVYYAALSSSCIKIIPDNCDHSIEVFINDEHIDSNSYPHITFNDTAKIVVNTDGKIKNYEVKPVAKPLTPEFSDAYGEFDFQYSSVKSNPLDAILTGSLKMYAIEQSAEIEDISKVLDKIEASYPAFKRICEKPKSHLKAINEVRPIDTVKRVGYESITYLASHSEDWLAKTASGLKPARLFSRVEDDDYQIYENRVVKTAIDLICSFLKHRHAKMEEKAEQINAILDSRVQTESFGFDAGFQKAVYELIPSDNAGDEHLSQQLELAKKLIYQLNRLKKKYRGLHQSNLYKYLHRAKRVNNPINATNILLLDKNYSVVFKLWKDIHQVIAPIEIDKTNPNDVAEQQKGYRNFCRTLCEYAAHTMNFQPIGDGVFLRKSDKIKIIVKEENGQINVKIMDAKKREMKISGTLDCPINDGESNGKFEFVNQTLYWSNNVSTDDIEQFCSLLKTRESRGKEQALEKARYAALKSEFDKKQREYGKPKTHMLVILPTFLNIEDESRNKVADYMKCIANHLSSKNTLIDYVVIALPVCESNEQKLTTYAKQLGEKTAFLPLTMFDINSYRRLQGLYLRLIMQLETDKCPYCGSNMRKSDSRFECTADDCRVVVTQTTCDAPSCKHKFTYLSYNIRQEVLNRMQNIDCNKYFIKDSIFQYKDIIDLSVSNKISPICPKCGK